MVIRRSDGRWVGVKFIKADVLNEKFDVYGKFYEVHKEGHVFQCRSLAIIKRKNTKQNHYDALIIMSNPGSCEPERQGDYIYIRVAKDTQTINLTLSKSDPTQHQIMRLMELREWNLAAVINLSDLRCGNMKGFKEKLLLSDQNGFYEHTIFSAEREKELNGLIENLKNGPIIVGWGTNRVNDRLIELVHEKLGRNIVGWKHSQSTYYHPCPHLIKDRVKWFAIVDNKLSIKGKNMNIRLLNTDEQPPMELLLLADPSKKIVEEYLNRGKCFIAENGKEIIGVYVLLPTRPETVELINVAVAEEHHGKGIGKNLVLNAIETAKSQGYKTIEIGTGNSSISQLALYQKCGFRISEIDTDFFIRHYDEEIYENGIRCRDMIRLSQDL